MTPEVLGVNFFLYWLMIISQVYMDCGSFKHNLIALQVILQATRLILLKYNVISYRMVYLANKDSLLECHLFKDELGFILCQAYYISGKDISSTNIDLSTNEVPGIAVRDVIINVS